MTDETSVGENTLSPSDQIADSQWMIIQMHRFQEITAALSAALTPEQVAEIILTEGIAALGAIAGSLAVLDSAGSTLHIISSVGYTAAIKQAFSSFPLDAAMPTANAVRTNTAIWLESKAAWVAAYPTHTAIIAASIYHAIAALPLAIEQRRVGGLGLSFSSPRQFNAEERAFAHSLTQQAAQALDRAQLYAQMERRVEQRDAVAQLGQQAISEPFEVLLNRVAAIIARTLAVPLSSVVHFIAEHAVFQLVAGVGWQPGLVGSAMFASEQNTQFDYCVQSQQPLVSADRAQELRFSVPAMLREHGVVSTISIPIIGRDSTFGVLSVHSTSPRIFSSDDVLFVQSVADIVAAAADRNTSERERLLLERQLLQTQKLESLGVLAGGIAHDFNNLLVVILGNASLALLELAPESPARESIIQIEQTAQRAADLTHQMLAYAGRGQFDIRKLNLSVLIEEMTHLLQASVSKMLCCATI